MQTNFANHLINESSPYLLQHAHNPVNWYPWGKEALERAKLEQKVILVSIGYSACHWCHVMERESFENEDTARLMNEHFVNIKIDREERPDLDHIYMDAVQAISGSGGWPLNVFLTPEAKPFFGGTYFPPIKAFNRSSWTEVLHGIAQAWAEKRHEIEVQAENLTGHLLQSNNLLQNSLDLFVGTQDGFFKLEQCHEMFTGIMKTADQEWGGFGKAPKFPQTFTIQYLLQYYYVTGNTEALQQALLSIDSMLLGGIYDHIGGGLARYSTDREWLAPHFEKMLYDNALLLFVLCDAYQLTSSTKYEVAIRKILAFITSELLSEEGGFYAALDADSEGEEGKYYVWQKDEIDEILGSDSALFCEYFDITEQGNWEGKNILRILVPAADFIAKKQLDKQDFYNLVDQSTQKLLIHRATRIRPGLDDKIILGWNALMLKAVTRAAIILKDGVFGELAEKNYRFLQQKFAAQSGEFFHTYKKGIAKYPAFLDDYAYLIAASIELYRLNFNEEFLRAAHEYCKYVVEHFSDEDGLFFYFTNSGQKDVIIRKKEVYDGATPSGNAIMAHNLQFLSVIFDEAEWRNRSDKMLESLSAAVIKYPGSFGNWATLLLQKSIGLNEVAIIGEDAHNIATDINMNYIPNLILMSSLRENPLFPLLVNKHPGPSTLIYLCRNYTCGAPLSDVQSLLKEINITNKIIRN